MCGISGFVSYNKRLSEKELLSMTDCIAHRGPDAAGYFYEEKDGVGAALGHRRLSIIDLSAGANQPMQSACGRYTIVYNGEVYNFIELSKSMLPGFPFRTSSDTEVVLETFAKYGVEAAQHWNGMFAMAIWDKHTQTLHLIRDRIGKKPLYYYWDGQNFAFASELKAIRNLPLELSVSKEAMAVYLNIGYIPQPFSIYREVNKMAPASVITLTKKEISRSTYWNAAAEISSGKETNESNAKKTLKQLLVDSVEHRMISDVPFGTFLSGGVDSSLVTAVAQSISGTRVKTFSIGFKEAKYDESGYAESVAAHLKTDHHTFAVSEEMGLTLVNEITSVYDEPYADPSAIPTMLVSRYAVDSVKMVLSGDGGDELFSGYGTYDWADRLSNPLIWHSRKILAAILKTRDERSLKAASILGVASGRNIQQHIFSQDQGFFSYEQIRDHFNLESPVEIFDIPSTPRKLSHREQQALFDLSYYLPDDLMVKVDRASMRYGLEVRCPLLDHRIVSFSLNLDASIKKKDGVAKYLLKQILYEYLPPALFDRPKWGFAFPLEKLMMRELAYLIDQYLGEDVTASLGICSPAFVRVLVQQYRSGKTKVYNKLWTLIQLHKWLLENGHGN